MKYLILLLLFLLTITHSQLYYRIPKNSVNEFVTNFLNDHQLNNCFQYTSSKRQLFLKCWVNNELQTVNIEIDSYYEIEEKYDEIEEKYDDYSLSIVI
tara:strand:- start:129 stop:422 length:294 start_codon:yes stop_codon:yes gene_type:complete